MILLYGVSMSNRNALGALIDMTLEIKNTTPIIMLSKRFISYMYMYSTVLSSSSSSSSSYV